jgi:enamine deaminase RidA (YjgF/YER057c/UK114 family)
MRELIQPEGVWDPRPKFVPVAKAGNHVYVAGQPPVDAEGNTIGEGDIDAQVRQVFENLDACLRAAGATFEDVVMLTVFSTDLPSHMATIGKYRAEYFGEPVPSSTVQVAGLVRPEWLVEIEAVAVVE